MRSGCVTNSMSAEPPAVKQERFEEPPELSVREWGDDVIFADKESVGAWYKIAPEHLVNCEDWR